MNVYRCSQHRNRCPTVFNERGNALFTTTGPLIENAGVSGMVVFPHLAEGGGYTMQFIVVGGTGGQRGCGLLRFLKQQGYTLDVPRRVQCKHHEGLYVFW